jgi:hypothetical protein
MSPRTQAKLNNNPDWVVREFEQPNPNDLRRDPANFQSGHYDDPNILAHMRMNDRPTAEGKRALFLEELQSDWAQQGRKQGFDTGVSIKYDPGVDAYRAYDTKGNMINLRVGNESFSALNSEQAVRDALANSKFSKGIPRAPYVEDTGDWTALGLKKAIEHAVEQGHDSVAWTTGAQQADRYNLSKQISEVRSNKNTDGNYSIQIKRNPSDTTWEHLKSNVDESELSDHLGKDLANKIIERNGGEFSGVDLRVGGEGMRGYYDQIVPQTANDILKSMGVTERVKPIGIGKELASPHAGTNYEIRDSAGDLWNTHRNAEDAQQYVDQQMSNPAFIEKGLTLSVNPIEPKYRPTSIQQGFDITPEIRDYVLNQGLPAFAGGGIVKAVGKEMSELLKLYHGGRKFEKWNPKMIGMGEGAGHPRPLLAQGPGLYAGDLPTLAKIYLPYGGDHPAMTELSVDPTNIIDYYNYKNITPEHREMIKEAESRLDKYGLNTTKYGLQNAWLGGRYPAHELVRNTLVESGIGGLKQNLDKNLLPGETRFGHEFSIFNPDIIKRVRTMDKSEYAEGGAVHMAHGGEVDYDELYEFKDYGNRETGEAKDTGALGEIRMPNGRDVMTEYSINVDGREMPSIVEGMHPADVNYIRETGIVPRDAQAVAVRSANKREASGQSPFWNRKDQPAFSEGGAVHMDEGGLWEGYGAPLERNTQKRQSAYYPQQEQSVRVTPSGVYRKSADGDVDISEYTMGADIDILNKYGFGVTKQGQVVKLPERSYTFDDGYTETQPARKIKHSDISELRARYTTDDGVQYGVVRQPLAKGWSGYRSDPRSQSSIGVNVSPYYKGINYTKNFAEGGAVDADSVDYDKHYEFIQPAFAHGGEVDYDSMYEFR